MKLLFKDINKVISDERISIYMRGLLFTALICKEKDNPKLTYAKFKACVPMKQSGLGLAMLHKWGYIEWSGFKSYEKSLKKKEDNPQVVEVIDFMNNLYGRAFLSTSDASTKGLRNRLEEHSVDDIKKVVANRYAEWKDDVVMSKHLTPQTIFRPANFDKYLEEAKRTHSGESLVQIDRLEIKHGDEFLYSMLDSLVDKDIYGIRTLEIDSNGDVLGKGKASKIYGKDLKRLLRIQEDRQEKGMRKEFEYKYQKD